MENDVLYNRIMNKVHEEYGSGGGGGGATIITVPFGAETVGLGMSFNDMKNAMLNGEPITFIFIITIEPEHIIYIYDYISYIAENTQIHKYAVSSYAGIDLTDEISNLDAEIFINPSSFK